jgi:hypothetical protein
MTEVSSFSIEIHGITDVDPLDRLTQVRILFLTAAPFKNTFLFRQKASSFVSRTLSYRHGMSVAFS